MNTRVELIVLAAQRTMPWANGGGVTREVAIEPAGAAAATCHWRVSVAQVASSGPFSHLPGIDRSTWLLRGAGVRLDVGGATLLLDRPLQRFDFGGEAAIVATLLEGPCEDLNVMTARAWGRADANVVELAPGAHAVLPRGAHRLALVLEGGVRVEGDAAVAGDGDALRVHGDGHVMLVALRASRVLLAAFSPHSRYFA